jgi:hypothetical protein
MAFEKPETFEGLDLDALRALSAEALEEARTIMASDDADLTDEQIAQAEALMRDSAEIDAVVVEREEAEAARAEKIAALREQAKPADSTPAEDPEEDPEPEVEDPADAEESQDAEAEKKEVVVAAAPAPKRTVAVARRSAPEVIVPDEKPDIPTLVAAADVPGFESGKELADFDELALAFAARARGFGNRNEEGLAPGVYQMSENARHYGVAKIKKPENEFTTGLNDPIEKQMEVIMNAAKESRLPGNSLVAAGGWCAPSEIWYDSFLRLEDANAGLLSIPEVVARRGGINFTKGPDFATLFANANFGFMQTEAQAIAGTAKPCYAVTCPPFTEVRLDAVGFCITAGILTNAAYPELIRRVLELALVGQRRRINAQTIARISTAAGTAINHAEVGGTNGATTSDLLDALTIQAIRLRYQYVMNPNTTIEVILPAWAKDVVRADLSRRNGVDLLAVTDADINRFFGVRNLNVQFVYDYQDFTSAATGVWTAFPTTVEAILYPAGAFVRLTSDVIDLDTIYDSTKLSTNDYTAAFFEEGFAVANVGATAVKVAVALNVKGSSGYPAVGAGTGVTIP